MPMINVHSAGVTPARLFKVARKALGFTRDEMQDALCVMDESTIRKIERGQIDVYGPTWVALRYLLDQAEEQDLVQQVDAFIFAIRKAASERREEASSRRGFVEVDDDELHDPSPLDYARDPR